MSVSLVSVLVSQPVLVCVVVLWYVAVFVSGGSWVRFWRGLASCRFCVLALHNSQIIIIVIIIIIIIIIYSMKDRKNV